MLSNRAVVSTAFIPQGVTVASGAPYPSADVSTVILGGSTLTGVILGQDSITFPRKKGFGFDCFYTGEVVSMARSNGRRTIGQIKWISAAGVCVDMGGGERKELPAAEIPHKMSKLLGLFYLSA